MTQRRILITAAVVAEVAPLIRRLAMRPADPAPDAGRQYVADSNDAHVRLIVTGVGPQRAVAAVEPILRADPPHRVIITGFAGALRPDLRVGDLLTAARLIDSATRAVFRPTWHSPEARDLQDLSLLTHNRIAATPEEKAALRARFGADAVDMESVQIAAKCDAAGIPWVCVRAISDAADHALPRDVERLTRPDGSADLPAAVWLALTRPVDIGRLIRLGRGAPLAARQIASKVPHLLTR